MTMSALDRLKHWARGLKRDIVALWIAARDPRVPWYAKMAAGAVAAYALSPIDIIPDFIPVFGYLDDLIIVPLGILMVVRLVPEDLMSEFREEAARREGKPKSLGGLLAMVVIWLALVGVVLYLIWPYLAGL